MMDTTNSLANEQCRSPMNYRIRGSRKAVSSPKRSIRASRQTLESSDSSSSSSESTVEDAKKSNQPLSRSSHHSPRKNHSNLSIASHGPKPSSLKSAQRMSSSDTQPSHSVVEGRGTLNEYFCKENNLPVPKIKLDQPTITSADKSDDDDEISVASSRSQLQRVRRGGRRAGTEREEESENAGKSPKQLERKDKFSFWDTETDSSESETELLQQSPPRALRNSGKSTMMVSPRKKKKAVSPPRGGKNITNGSGDNSRDNVTAKEKAPVRRAPPRNNSGWHTGGSFSEDESECSKEKQSRNSSLSKLSLAALRMSRSDRPSFSFTKNNATLDSYSTHGNDPQSASRTDENDDFEQSSTHSSASKTTSSYVSGGGWSTGKDTSSEEGEAVRQPKKKEKIESIEPDKESFDKPKPDFKFSGHSKEESKVSFITGDDASLESGSTFSNDSSNQGDDSHGITTDSGIRLDSKEKSQNGTVVFDLSAMEFDTEGIFEDGPCSPAKRRDVVVRDIATAAPKKAKKENGFFTKEKTNEKKDRSKLVSGSHEHGEKKKSKTKKEKPKKSKDETVKATKSKVKKKKSGEEKGTACEKSKKKKNEGVKKATMPAPAPSRPATYATTGDPFLEERRKERAARLEKAKERIRNQEAAKKAEEDARKKRAAAKPKKVELSEQERLERAYQWYTRCGMITKAKLKQRIHRIDYCEITEDDIDLLPWMAGDRIVNVAKMTKIIAGM